MLLGKKIRIERILDRNTGRSVIVPLDHGVTVGPIRGLVDFKETIDSIASGGANAVLGHIGLPLHGHRGKGRDVGLILHLSGSTIWSPDPNSKVLVNNVWRAIKIGADAVSIHINIGAENETEMLKDFGDVAEECFEWGMPLLAMMYTRGKKFKSEYDPEAIAHAARIAAELGADIVKVSYTGSADTFKKVVEGTPIPVVIAGGEKLDKVEDIFQIIYDSLQVGGAGVSIGRNVFQSERPIRMTRAISSLVNENKTVKQALEIYYGAL